LDEIHKEFSEEFGTNFEFVLRPTDEQGTDRELTDALGAGGRIRTCTPLREGDFKPNQKGRRINVYLIRRPFPFTRVTRSALQSEE